MIHFCSVSVAGQKDKNILTLCRPVGIVPVVKKGEKA
jgi:hypothetical protein